MTKRIRVWAAFTVAWVLAGASSAMGQVGPGGVVGEARGGVVGGTPAPRSGGVILGAQRRTGATPADAPPAVPIVLAKTFPAVPPDPIERSEFNRKEKPIEKNLATAMAMMVTDGPDGDEIGLAAPVIAAVTRNSTTFSAAIIKKQAAVGPEMLTSFDEAVRAVQMRYPKIEPAHIEFSFGDKYTPHEGGSAGTCFAVMLLSTIEGFEIDTKCAVTGDITVDWKVQKIGGLAAKVRGSAADKCLYTGVPLDNRTDVYDMALFYGDQSLRDIQVFSLETLQDAVALLRKDRSPQLTEAIKEFDALKPKLTGGRNTFSQPAILKVLQNIVELAPNHESAKMMIEMAKGTFPRALSNGFALDQFRMATQPYALIIMGKEPATKATVTPTMTAAARKALQQLGGISPPTLVPLIADAKSIVDAADGVASGVTKPTILDTRREAFFTDLEKLENNKDFMDKLFRGN